MENPTHAWQHKWAECLMGEDIDASSPDIKPNCGSIPSPTAWGEWHAVSTVVQAAGILILWRRLLVYS